MFILDDDDHEMNCSAYDPQTHRVRRWSTMDQVS